MLPALPWVEASCGPIILGPFGITWDNLGSLWDHLDHNQATYASFMVTHTKPTYDVLICTLGVPHTIQQCKIEPMLWHRYRKHSCYDPKCWATVRYQIFARATIWLMYIYIYIYVYFIMWIQVVPKLAIWFKISIYMYIYIYIHMYIRIYISWGSNCRTPKCLCVDVHTTLVQIIQFLCEICENTRKKQTPTKFLEKYYRFSSSCLEYLFLMQPWWCLCFS